MDDLLTIGRFARLTGLSVAALRHLAAGDLAEVAAWKAKATAALDGIADKDDRDLIEGDLATLP